MRKYILIFLLLLSTLSYSQTESYQWTRAITNGNGTPSYDPFPPNGQVTVNYMYYDKMANEWYRHIAGTNWVKDSLIFKGQKGDPGNPGVPGPPGGGGAIDAIVVPPTQDQAGLQWAMNNSVNKCIYLSGTYSVHTGVDYALNPGFVIFGNRAIISTSNSNTFSVFYRSNVPTTKAQAEALAGQIGCRIQDLTINLQGLQKGVDLNSNSNCSLEKVFVYGGKTGFQLDYCMKGRVTQCQVNGAQNGFMVSYVANDQEMSSNYLKFEQCETHTVSQIGFGIYKAYGVVGNQCVVEGNGTIQRAVDFDGLNKGTNWNFTWENFHFEQVGGAVQAVGYLRLANQKCILSNWAVHYPGLLVDASSQGGNGLVVVSYFAYGVGDSGGKMFKSSNCTWSFNYNEVIKPYSYNVWTSPAPNYCNTPTGSGCGYNAFSFGGIISR